MGSPEVIERLWITQHSRRLLLLKIFQDAIEKDHSLLGPLPPIDEAWRMLERVQTAHPSLFARLIRHPQVGSWLAYVLRRHGGGAQSDTAWYVDFGQIHALALAAAALAGEAYATRVPLRDGRIMVPCFGMAQFSGCAASEVAEAETVEGQIRIRYAGREVGPGKHDDNASWLELRRVKVGSGPALEVWLDDLDPLRDLADPVPPVRLSDTEAERWIELLHDAWEILSTDHREMAQSLAMGVTSIVPLPSGDGWDTRSASSGDAFGAVMCSLPPDGVTLAVSLAHEFAHIRLGGLMHLLPITVDSTEDRCLYAPWRDDPRPLGGLIQGVYAFVSIAAFWRKHRRTVAGEERMLAEFEYAYARAQAEEGLATASAANGLTEFGAEFLTLLTQEVGSWQDDPLADEPVRLAQLVARGHRIGWRLRHCRPDPDEVTAVVSAWHQGNREPLRIGPPETLPDPAMRHWSQGRLGLARRQLQAPQSCIDALGESWGRALTDADLALFAGDSVTAAKEFSLQIVSGARSEAAADAWAGLAMALGADQADPGGAILSRHPELVQAVYAKVNGGPIELARWIGSVVTG